MDIAVNIGMKYESRGKPLRTKQGTIRNKNDIIDEVTPVLRSYYTNRKTEDDAEFANEAKEVLLGLGLTEEDINRQHDHDYGIMLDHLSDHSEPQSGSDKSDSHSDSD